MKVPLIASLCVVMMASAAPAQTLQETPGSRILVTECDPHRHTATQAHPWIDPYGTPHEDQAHFPTWDAFLGISYQNQATVAATEVDFGLVARGSLVAVAKDIGRFSPGVLIEHEFVVSSEIFPLGSAVPYCAVLRVKYADGSMWHNPSPPAP